MSSTFIDLFAGAGGLSFGLESAGFDCLLATDNWGDALQTHGRNLPASPLLLADVHDLDRRTLAKHLDDRPDWVVGGPPCQGYSTVGKRVRDDRRNALFIQFCKVVKTLRPRGFVLENVLGLKDMRFVEPVSEAFREIGYRVSSHVLVAADYGVPQLRRRVVFVGTQDDLTFLGPEPDRSPLDYVTVIEAIGDLPELEPGEEATTYRSPATNAYQVLMRAGSDALQGHWASRHPQRLIDAISYIPDGGNRTHIPPALQPKSGFHNSYSRLASDAPAVAVTSNMGKPSATRCIHPRQNRGLTTREGARLQSFPDRFHFLGPSTSQRLQVANAVPPLLGAALGRALLDEGRWAGHEQLVTAAV